MKKGHRSDLFVSKNYRNFNFTLKYYTNEYKIL